MKKYLEFKKSGFTPLQIIHGSRGKEFVTGFTFLEVLASLVVLSVALIPIMTWVPISLQTKTKTERRTIAIFLAQSKMEELRYKIINAFDTNRTTASAQTFPNPYEVFYYNITDNLANADFKNISVEVWHNENSQDKTTFSTQISRR